MEAREFEWESQLRFYWEKDPDTLMVQQCTGQFGFGYEYMGLNGRLVITPLTDRIYLTITQALSMHLGGAPAGPAGTGKTETVKDLAKAMGLLCVVTNCGEGMDFKVYGHADVERACAVLSFICLAWNDVQCDFFVPVRLLESSSLVSVNVEHGGVLTNSTELIYLCSL